MNASTKLSMNGKTQMISTSLPFVLRAIEGTEGLLTMNGNRGFDEVMIVNPSEANGGGRFMRFHYAQPPEMGYYAEPPEMYDWGEPDMYGQYEPVGYYAEDPYLAEDPY